jgi:hypothetical protein
VAKFSVCSFVSVNNNEIIHLSFNNLNMKIMKNFKAFLILLAFAAVFVTCSKKDDSVKKDDPNDTISTTGSNVILKPGTLTLTMNGDGYTNKTITFTGQKGDNTCLWTVRYVKDPIEGLGPDNNYSYTGLYYMPPKYSTSFDSSASVNGAVAFRFSGNKTINNDPWSFTDLYTFRGILEFSFKKNLTDAESVMYMIEDGVTIGSTTVTEYGPRVKGTFTATKMQRFDLTSPDPVFVDISGSFDLDITQ